MGERGGAPYVTCSTTTSESVDPLSRLQYAVSSTIAAVVQWACSFLISCRKAEEETGAFERNFAALFSVGSSGVGLADRRCIKWAAHWAQDCGDGCGRVRRRLHIRITEKRRQKGMQNSPIQIKTDIALNYTTANLDDA